jgi:hypothetical protein
MTDKRQQLTLFVPEAFSGTIELVRSQFNPLQHQLIAAHVTLCREDEITDIETILHNLQKESLAEITIHFGDIIRFQEGKGALLPAFNADESFQKLRQQILTGSIEQPRNHEAHITLMHPRNATCTDEIFQELQKFEFPKSITFHEICLIEQEIGKEWKTLKRFTLQ